MSKRILGVVLILTMIVALCLVVFQKQKPAGQSAQFPDGSELTFLGTTLGTNATYVWGKNYQRTLYKLLPGKYKSRSGVSLYSLPSALVNEPVFWWHASTNIGYLDIREEDEFGCEWDQFGSGSAQFLPDSPEMIYAVQISSIGRFGKIVGFAVYDRPTGKRVGEFMQPGTALTVVPRLNPPIPIQQDDNLSIQMVSLVSGFKTPGYPPGISNGLYYSQAVFRITTNGVPDPSWTVALVMLSDAQGKEIPQGKRRETNQRNGNMVYNFEGALESSAGPIKTHVVFANTETASVEDLVTFTNLPFPASNKAVEMHLERSAQGQKVILEGVQDGLTEQPLGLKFDARQPLIQTQFVPTSDEWGFGLDRAMDENGIKLSTMGIEYASGKFSFNFSYPTKPKYMTISFVVYRHPVADFFVTPVIIPTSDALSSFNH